MGMLLATNNQLQPKFSLEASISSTMFGACFDIYPHDTNRRWFSNYIKYSNYNTRFNLTFIFYFFKSYICRCGSILSSPTMVHLGSWRIHLFGVSLQNL